MLLDDVTRVLLNACLQQHSSAVDVDRCFSFLQKRGVCLDGILPQGKPRMTDSR